MKKTSKKIVFFGNERLATGVTAKPATLQALLNAGYGISKIFAKHELGNKAGSKLEVDQLASDAGIPLSLSTDIDKIRSSLKELGPDVGVLVAYGLILPEDIIEMFPDGIINIHPSLLPEGRGPAPIEQAILGGRRETGVSIMKIGKDMDKGPLLAQRKVDLIGNETKQELADTLQDIGSGMLVDSLSDIFSKKAVFSPQTETTVTYTHKIKKSDGIIDWGKPARQIEREIRAYADWPKSSTKISSIDCILTEAEILEEKGPPGNYLINGKSLILFATEGALLVKRVKPSGRKEMSADEFIRGYGSKL